MPAARKDLHVFFLNLDVGKDFTGIESSAFLRARIFEEHLGLSSTFVSTYFNVNLKANIQRLVARGLIPDRLRFANLFDWFQGTGTLEPGRSEFVPPKGHVLAPVSPDSADRRLFRNGVQTGFVKFDPETGSPIFVNHLREGKPWARDWYFPNGVLAKSDFVDPFHATSDPVCEYFWDAEGCPALLREHLVDDKKRRRLGRIHHLQKGRVIETFESHDELVARFLEALIDPARINVLIMDRGTEYMGALLRLRAKYPAALRLVGMIHNTHYVNGIDHPGDPMNSELSSFYKDVLCAPDLCDAVVILTQHQRQDIEARMGPGPYHVIPHALQAVPPLKGIQRDLKRLVIVSRFAEEKQLHLAIEAFAKVAQRVPDAHLHCYGTGAKRDLMQQTIERLALGERVSIHGFDPDVNRIFQSAGLLLLSSRNEGFPITLLQSIFNHCPVVAFDCRYGPREIIQDGVNGRLCKPQDVGDLAEKIIQILLDSALHKKLIEGCAQSIPRFTHEAVAGACGALLDALAPSK